MHIFEPYGVNNEYFVMKPKQNDSIQPCASFKKRIMKIGAEEVPQILIFPLDKNTGFDKVVLVKQRG